MIGHIIIFLRSLLLMFSCYGYLQFLRKRIKLEFTIALLFAAIGSTMFLAGILNLMWETALLIFLGGLFLAACSLQKRESPCELISPGIVFFSIGCIFLLFLLRGNMFSTYDNFSHWATALKAVYTNNRFPNFSNINIGFQSYPLGSASFIYYICKIAGIFSEWSQMYAQAVLMAGMLLSLFAFAESLEGWLLAGTASVMLLCSNTALYDMCVDTLLPLTALAGIALCLYEQDHLRKIGWAAIPFTVFLVSIKNSGILFAIFIAAFVMIHLSSQFRPLYHPPKNTDGPENTLFTLFSSAYCLIRSISKFLCRNEAGCRGEIVEETADYSEAMGYWKTAAPQFLCPVLTLVLWQKHVKLVFENGMGTKHSMSLMYWRARFLQKSSEDVHTILSGMGERIFSLSNPFFYILLLLILVIVARKYFLRQNYTEERQTALIVLVSYIVYQLGLLGTYLFPCPLTREET